MFSFPVLLNVSESSYAAMVACSAVRYADVHSSYGCWVGSTRAVLRQCLPLFLEFQMSECSEMLTCVIDKLIIVTQAKSAWPLWYKGGNKDALLETDGSAVAQVVSPRRPTAVVRIRARVKSCVIPFWQGNTGAGFLRVFRFLLTLIQFNNFSTLITIYYPGIVQ
jgi:hypothetical protein